MIRHCLRNFGDDECVSILKHIVDAMVPDNKLLIADTVTSNAPSWFPAMLGFFLSTIGGKKRTEENFRGITARAGLKVTGVHYSDKAGVRDGRMRKGVVALTLGRFIGWLHMSCLTPG